MSPLSRTLLVALLALVTFATACFTPPWKHKERREERHDARRDHQRERHENRQDRWDEKSERHEHKRSEKRERRERKERH